MSKKFSDFREELIESQLNEEISFGDLSDEILFHIIVSESADEYHYINAMMTLFERELIDLSEEDLTNLFEAPLSDFGTVGQKVDAGRARNAKDLQQSKQMSKLSQSSIPTKSTTVNPAKPMLPTAVQSKDMAAKPTATASTSGPKPLSAGGSARANVEAGRAANASKSQAMKSVAKMNQSSMSVAQAKSAQAGLDAARNTGSSAKTTVGNALKSAGSKISGVMKNIANSSIAKKVTSNPLLSKLASPAVKAVAKPLAALDTGLAAGELAKSGLNKLGSGSVNNKTTGNISQLNAKKPGSGVQFKGDLPTLPSDKPKTAPASTGNAAKPVQKSISKPSAPVQKSVPKPSAPVQKSISKPSAPKTNNALGMKSSDYNDLKMSAYKMQKATNTMADKTGAMKTSLQKAAPSGRMERPITPGGQSSSQIKSAISKLGAEPVPKALPKAPASKPAAVSGGAPTTAVGSKPPSLDRSTAKKM